MKSNTDTLTGGGNAPRIQFQIMHGTEDCSTTGYPACDMFRDLIARVNNGERDPRAGGWSLRPVMEDGTTYAGGWETITRNARGEHYGQEDQESASVRRWSAIYALDFALFGGEATKEVFGNVIRYHARGIECQDSLREAFYELCRHPWPSNAAKVYALRGNRAQSGDADVAFARLAAAYAIGSAPYLQPESGTGNSAVQYRDGQTIPLSLGWSLYLCHNDCNGNPYLQGFVHSPKNRCSASLAAARDLGMTTGDYEIEIPAKVMRELADEEFDQFD